MLHTLKIFLKIINSRMHQKLDMDISETQFGFRNGLGTREWTEKQIFKKELKTLFHQ